MKTLRITLEGKTYEVGVEVVDGVAAPAQPAVAAAPVAVPVAAPAPVAIAPVAAPAPVAAGGHAVTSPMPGVVLKVRATVGQQVSKDQELLVLEAMKMESPICASSAGTVAAILVKEGDAVNEGQVLVQLS